ISDNDFLTMNSPSDVSEDAGVAVVTILRNGDTQAPLSISYYTTDGSAFAGVDYEAVSGTLTFAAGESQKSFDIPILDNNRPDTKGRGFTVTASYGSTWLSQAQIAIDDNEKPIILGNPTYAVPENVGSAPILIQLPIPFSNTVITVDYATSDGTA